MWIQFRFGTKIVCEEDFVVDSLRIELMNVVINVKKLIHGRMTANNLLVHLIV